MSKTTYKQISIMMRQMGYDPLELTKELRKRSVQSMTLKERCEYINRMIQVCFSSIDIKDRLLISSLARVLIG